MCFACSQRDSAGRVAHGGPPWFGCPSNLHFYLGEDVKLVAGTAWTLASQIYMAGIAVITVPLYLAIFGQTVYGLIAFFLQLQMVISLLDIGVSATVSRNTALFKVDKLARNAFFSSVNSIELIFLMIAVVLVAFAFAGSNWLVMHWLDIEDLDKTSVIQAVELMVVIVALRWLQTFYRASLFGAELMIWVAKLNVLTASFRVIGVLPFLWWVSDNIIDYFWFQLVANLLELAILVVKSQQVLGYAKHERFGMFNLTDVSAAIKSSSVIGATSLVWAVIAQLDKLAASGNASLSDYTAYSLVVTLCSLLLLLSAPIVYTIGPRMAKLLAAEQHAEAVTLFRNASLAIVVLLSPAFVVTLLWGESLLWAWTVNRPLSQLAASYIPLYLAGALAFALNYLSYSICYAIGDFRLRLKLSMYFLALYVPLLATATYYAGLTGLAFSWCLVNIGFFVLAQPALYAKLQTGLFLKSLRADIITPVAGTLLLSAPMLLLDIATLGRFEVLGFLFIMFIIGLAGAVLFSRARQELLRYKRRAGV